MSRRVSFVYGVVCYAVFFGTFLYSVGFLGNFWVPKSMNSGISVAVGQSVAINMVFLGIFALQHSIMARPGFKTWWTGFVPEQVERSTYTLLSSVVLLLLFWQWRPMPTVVWQTEAPAVLYWMLRSLFFLGFVLVLYATCLINHFDLFGLRQVFLHLRGIEYTPLKFKTPSLYKFVRHPLYVGWFLAFWAAPLMTQGQLLLAVVASVYIFVAVVFEERDLVQVLGDDYSRYRQRVPMFVPWPRGDRTADPKRPVDTNRT